MKLKIVCFEDDSKDMERLKVIFADYEVEFLWFVEPQTEWQITDEQIERIAQFCPTFAIVDIIDDTSEVHEGERVVRKLKEAEEAEKITHFPIIVWSKLLKNDKTGEETKNRIENLRGIPLFKNRNNYQNASEFLSKIGL